MLPLLHSCSLITIAVLIAHEGAPNTPCHHPRPIQRRQTVGACIGCTVLGVSGMLGGASSFVLGADGLWTARTLVLLLQHVLWHIHRVVHRQAAPVHIDDLARHVARSI